MREIFGSGAINWQSADRPLEGRVLVALDNGLATFAKFEDGEWVDDAMVVVKVRYQARPPHGPQG